MNRSLFSIFVILPLLLVCHLLSKFLLYLDINKRVYNHAPGSCSNVAGIEYGAEDAEILYDTLILVSTGCKKFDNPELDNSTGRMYLYNTSARTAWELKINSKTLSHRNFYPHGLSVWQENGKHYVFVVNHRPKSDTVEVFLYDGAAKALNHTRSIKSPSFITLEDVSAITKTRFFAINAFSFRSNRLRAMELLLATPTGNVVFFDGTKSSVVVGWFPAPAGLIVDVSKKWLYVSSLTRSCIYVFRIGQNYSLTAHSTIPLATAPDNLFIDRLTSADLYVASHPVKYRKFRHEFYPKSSYTPSQILKIRGRPSRGNWTITEVYANDGATLSGASVAVRFKNKLVIGSTFDKLMVCDIDYPDLI